MLNQVRLSSNILYSLYAILYHFTPFYKLSWNSRREFWKVNFEAALAHLVCWGGTYISAGPVSHVLRTADKKYAKSVKKHKSLICSQSMQFPIQMVCAGLKLSVRKPTKHHLKLWFRNCGKLGKTYWWHFRGELDSASLVPLFQIMVMPGNSWPYTVENSVSIIFDVSSTSM